jgi:pimeloyl-ACP methyl ester carboxylesterase
MKKKCLLLIVCISTILSFPLLSDAKAEEKLEIDRLEQVELGGAKQWVLMRSTSSENPVLLYLHGGPGFAMIPYSHRYSAELEKNFIVVHWDQRGSGKSFDAGLNPGTMKMDRFLSDTYELITWLKSTFKKEKIFLMGHSWGSILGFYTVLQHPDDFYGYIGMGQVINMMEGERLAYKFTLDSAIMADDQEAIAQLKRIGEPPYKNDFQSVYIYHKYLGNFGGFIRNLKWSDFEKIRKESVYYSEAENKNYMTGYGKTSALLWDEVMKADFTKEKLNFKIPVVFLLGRYDYGTPSVLVEKFFEGMTAPDKKIIWFEDSAHLPNLDEPVRFQNELIQWSKEILKKYPVK